MEKNITPKYRIYIDEVGNNDLGSSSDPNHRYLSLTGLIFELNYVKNVVIPSLDKLKRNYFPNDPDEPLILHRKKILSKKYPFNVLKDKNKEENFNNDLINILTKFEYTVVSVLIDKYEHRERYRVWKYDPYHYCLEIILERFYFFLDNNNCNGDVLIESRGGKEDLRLKKSYSKIFESGTHYIEGEKLRNRLTSKEIKVKPKESNIAGLQLADLIAHPSRRFIFREFGIDEGKISPFADRIIEVIQNKYYKGESGIIKGYGIKFLP